DVVLSVQVSPAPAGGTVQFKDGGTNIGGVVNLDSEGRGSITQQFAAAGARSITAVYSGAGEFQGSTSAAHTVTVSAPVPTDVATTTTATAPATATTGVAVDLWAKVKGPNGDPIPSGGTIFFKDGGALIGKTVNAVNGEAKLSHTFTTVGAHTITAEFGGTTGFLTSVSQPSTVEVSAPVITDVATTTALAMPATAKNGAAVNLVATVSPTPAGGTVQFMDGATPLGAPVGLLAGKATRSQAFTTAGEHQITAIYSGAPGHLTSTTEVGIITVDEPVEGGNGAGGSLGNLFGSS
ncbi:Ig-like domain-containing protein, partial [Rhodococcus tukisamuensis]